MTTAIADQPPPVATDRRPAWEIVAAYVDRRRDQSAHAKTGVIGLVLADMRERDAVGRARYGVPLTSGNGRDHLVDAYQEYLDSAVYLATELDEHGASLDEPITSDRFPDTKELWHLHCVQQLFRDQIRALVTLRALIEERRS